MGGPDPHRRPRNMFKKRKRTLIKKGDELARLTSSKIYILIENPRGITVYNSHGKNNAPPPDFALENIYKDVKRLDGNDVKETDELAKKCPDKLDDDAEQHLKRVAERERIIVPKAPDLLMSIYDNRHDSIQREKMFS